MQNYDIVHVHLFPAQLWAVLAQKRLGGRIPLVTTEHGTSNYSQALLVTAFRRMDVPTLRMHRLQQRSDRRRS